MNRESEYDYRHVKDHEPLYVLNGSAGEGRKSGVIHFNVKDGNDLRAVVIENTHIPQDITNQALPSQIATSMEFRRLVGARVVLVVPPDEARAILATPAAQAELQLLRDVKARGHSSAHVVRSEQEPPATFDVTDQAAGSDTVELNVGVELLDRLQRGEMSLDDAVTTMRGLGPMLKPEEKLRLKQVRDVPPAMREAIAMLK